MKERTTSQSKFPLPQGEKAPGLVRENQHGRNWLKMRVFVPALVVVSFIFWGWLWRWDPQIYRENGPMENFQVGCLAVGIFFLLRAVRRGASNPARRLFLGGVILLYGTFLLLEFDVREFHIRWLTLLLDGTVRNAWIGTLWMFGFILFLRRARSTWAEFVVWVRTPAGVLLLLSGFFWAAGWLVDHLKPFASRGQNLLIEEFMESNAAPLMLISAILTFRNLTKRTPDTGGVP